MSETDSDLDFESADEDAEFASNIQKNVDSGKGAKKPSSIHNQSSEVPKVINEVISEVKKSIEDEHTGQSLNTSTEVQEDHVQEGMNEIAVKLNKEKVSSEDIKTQSEELINMKEDANKKDKEQDECEVVALTKEKVSNDNIKIPSEELIYTKEDTNKKNKEQDKCESANSTAVNVPEAPADQKSADPEFQPEKPRVVLRIEKKKQQRSQFSKEASMEKEKASDLVNILREEPPPPVSIFKNRIIISYFYLFRTLLAMK